MAKQRANISNAHTIALYNLLQYNKDFPQSIKIEAQNAIRAGWQFRAVDQSCGRCYYNIKTVTIPLWCLKGQGKAKQHGYLYWYIAHELAHVKAGYAAQHGQAFQEALIAICPKEFVVHETGYKPSNAAAALIKAGIVPQEVLDDLNQEI